MSSNTAKLPPYSEKQPSKETSSAPISATSRIAGTVQTGSIRDFQVDYLTIVRDSATSYHISLTVDPTPLYRIELVSEFSKVGHIQIFPASDSTLPAIAAARLSDNPKGKGEPPATICTSSPHLPDAHWRALSRDGPLFVKDYVTSIPIITVPGRPAEPHQFKWRSSSLRKPFYQLYWEEGPLPLVPSAMYMKDERGSEYVFATLAKKTPEGGENLLEIRRWGGIEFELSVILELFLIQHLKKEELL